MCNHQTIPLPRHCVGHSLFATLHLLLLWPLPCFRRLTSRHHAIWAPCPLAKGWVWPVEDRKVRRKKGQDTYPTPCLLPLRLPLHSQELTPPLRSGDNTSSPCSHRPRGSDHSSLFVPECFSIGGASLIPAHTSVHSPVHIFPGGIHSDSMTFPSYSTPSPSILKSSTFRLFP